MLHRIILWPDKASLHPGFFHLYIDIYIYFTIFPVYCYYCCYCHYCHYCLDVLCASVLLYYSCTPWKICFFLSEQFFFLFNNSQSVYAKVHGKKPLKCRFTLLIIVIKHSVWKNWFSGQSDRNNGSEIVDCTAVAFSGYSSSFSDTTQIADLCWSISWRDISKTCYSSNNGDKSEQVKQKVKFWKFTHKTKYFVKELGKLSSRAAVQRRTIFICVAIWVWCCTARVQNYQW